jgi:hypothetical protein
MSEWMNEINEWMNERTILLNFWKCGAQGGMI